MWSAFVNKVILLAASGILFPKSVALGNADCPEKCECLQSYIDCSKKNLQAVPHFSGWSERIDMSNNRLHSISVVDFSYLPDLKEISFNNCSLRNVPHLILPSSFGTLHLIKNHITTITAKDFENSNSIKYLHLSNNKIKHIEESAFQNLTQLKELKLNKNDLQHLGKSVFHSLNNLKSLELNRNNLHNISTLVFSDLEQLMDLKLKYNHIEIIMDGAFLGLKTILVLNLDFNKISTISKGWMYGLETLKTLTLSHNSITNIDRDCWEISNNLKELDLSYNNISAIEANTFQHLKNLRVLNLNANKISSIYHRAFSHTPLLLELFLNSNEISWTIEDMSGPFIDLVNLQKLGLANNHIKSINPKAFEGLIKLNEINLNDNNISSIHENAFQPLSSLKKFYLNSKTLLCVCNLQWLISWMQRIEDSGVNATCGYPPALFGKSILKLKNEYCSDSPRPVVVEHPKPQLAIRGKSAEIRCTAQSKPYTNMSFVWKKNNAIWGGSVSNSIINTEDGEKEALSTLIISNVSHSDTGKYQCVVTNDFGSTYSNKAKVDIVTFPKFTMTPTNATVKTSETVSLKCAATGDPNPEISWQKDGGSDFPAARERRMHVMPDDHLFFIVNAKPSDNGIYSCAAKNPAGLIVSNATLTVLEEPTFVTVSENKEVSIADSAVLQCMITGSPKPEILWFKDGNPIKKTDRFLFTTDEQVLIILNSKESDAGFYECQITNELGTKNSRTLLKVLPAVVNEDDMTGIIIITVVSCAVGTSIVWVVIICQTRRRLTNATATFTADNINMSPFIFEREVCSPAMLDNVSEKSSCKDSGTGDSTKQCYELVNSPQEHFITEPSVCQNYSPSTSSYKYLQSSFKPNLSPCIND